MVVESVRRTHAVTLEKGALEANVRRKMIPALPLAFDFQIIRRAFASHHPAGWSTDDGATSTTR